MTKAERQIDGLFDEVSECVVRNHVEAYPGIFLEKRRNGRDDDPTGEGIRTGYAEQADRLVLQTSGFCFGRFIVGNQVHGAPVEALARLGQAECAGCSLEEGHIQLGFQILDPARHRWLAHAEGRGRLGEIARFGYANE